VLNKLLNIQHRFNPLHIYCRLIDKGLDRRFSFSICKYYEILIYSWLVWITVIGVQMCRLVKTGS